MIMYLWVTPVSVSAQLMRHIIEPPITQPLTCTVHCTPVLFTVHLYTVPVTTCSPVLGPRARVSAPLLRGHKCVGGFTMSCQLRSGAAGERT